MGERAGLERGGFLLSFGGGGEGHPWQRSGFNSARNPEEVGGDPTVTRPVFHLFLIMSAEHMSSGELLTTAAEIL